MCSPTVVIGYRYNQGQQQYNFLGLLGLSSPQPNMPETNREILAMDPGDLILL